MIYQAVGDRIAVDFSTWPGIDAERACSTLQKQGFRREIFDPEWYAQGLIGRRNVFYACGLHSKNAPKAVDCSSLMKYLFGLCGIWIPRRAVQQKAFGIKLDRPEPWSLVFKTGACNLYEDSPKYGVGHVGLVTDHGTVIHAVDRPTPVVEVPLREFIARRGEYRGAARIIHHPEATYTFSFPPELEIETSDDVRWRILKDLTPTP